MSPDLLQVVFLPWVGVKEALEFGPVHFWPYYQGRAARITDDRLREHLDRVFGSYVGHDGKPVDTITLCSHNDVDVGIPDATTTDAVRVATDALAFVAIASQTEIGVCADNPTWAPPAGDIFETLVQHFRIGDDRIVVASGATLSGGWRIGSVRFEVPWSTGGRIWSMKPELISGLQRYLIEDPQKRDIGTLSHSLQWFRLAHAGTISYEIRVVMMATAFEALFRCVGPQKALALARCVEASYHSYNLIRQTREIGREMVDLSMPSWWMYDFYRLRNQILHEGFVPRDSLGFKGWIDQMIVADLVFTECVRDYLFTVRCLGNEVRELAARLGDSSEEVARLFVRERCVTQVLGWEAEDSDSTGKGDSQG